MKKVPDANVVAYKDNLPNGIAARCGVCSSNEFFRPETWTAHGTLRYSAAHCPFCKRHAFFAVADWTDDRKRLGGGELFMHPSAEERSIGDEMKGALEKHTEIFSDYKLAIRAFNDDDPIAIVLAARRLLEGLARCFIPPDQYKDRLAVDLASLKEHHDLSSVIHEMSEAINAAGTLGAHIGASRLTNDIARKCFYLADEFIRMHFLLALRVRDLQVLVREAKAMPVAV